MFPFFLSFAYQSAGARLLTLLKYFRTPPIEHHLNRAIRHNASIGTRPRFISGSSVRGTFLRASNDNATAVAGVRKKENGSFDA